MDGLFRDVGDRLRSDLLRAKVIDGDGTSDIRVKCELLTISKQIKRKVEFVN